MTIKTMVRIVATLAACAALPVYGQDAAAPAGQDAAAPAAGQEATAAGGGRLLMQLNNAQSVEDGCQLTFAIRNDTGEAIERSTYNMAILDGQGQVTTLISFGFPAFPVGRTRFQQFKLEGQSCDNISGISINDFAECTAADGGASQVCEQRTVESTKTDIQFPWELQ